MTNQTWRVPTPPIVIIGRFRYSNASMMGVGHDWAEENSDLTWEMGAFNETLSEKLLSQAK